MEVFACAYCKDGSFTAPSKELLYRPIKIHLFLSSALISHVVILLLTTDCIKPYLKHESMSSPVMSKSGIESLSHNTVLSDEHEIDTSSLMD